MHLITNFIGIISSHEFVMHPMYDVALALIKKTVNLLVSAFVSSRTLNYTVNFWLHLKSISSVRNYIDIHILCIFCAQNLSPSSHADSFIHLEQLERLRSENTPRRPIITHTTDSYQIPCHNKTKWKYWIPKKMPKIQIL